LAWSVTQPLLGVCHTGNLCANRCGTYLKKIPWRRFMILLKTDKMIARKDQHVD
jgi:hypothetical protein